MWDFPGDRDGGRRFLVLGLGAGSGADVSVPPGQDELIAYGPLLAYNNGANLQDADWPTSIPPPRGASAYIDQACSQLPMQLARPRQLASAYLRQTYPVVILPSHSPPAGTEAC